MFYCALLTRDRDIPVGDGHVHTMLKFRLMSPLFFHLCLHMIGFINLTLTLRGNSFGLLQDLALVSYLKIIFTSFLQTGIHKCKFSCFQSSLSQPKNIKLIIH